MRLRTSLLLLILATVVPLLAFAIVASALLVRHQQDNFVTAVKDRNRAFMSAVDADLRGSVEILQALSASRSLERGDLAAFHQDAGALLKTQPAWQTIILAAPDGRHLANAVVRFGAPLPLKPRQPDSFAAVANTLRPVIGGVAEAEPTQSRLGIRVRVPVLRDGKLAYVLTAVIKPESFQPLIQAQHLPEGWTTGLVDGNGKLVARIPERPPGTAASEIYLKHVRSAPEGWYRGATLDGLDTYTAFTSSAYSGWSVGFAIPAGLVLGGPKQALLLMVLGVALSLALAIVIALWLGRRITHPMAALAEAAGSLGSHAEPIRLRTRISEIDALAGALNDASQAIRERDTELRGRAEALRAADRNKSEFLAMLSHELRNPLAPLQNGLSILRLLGEKGRAAEVRGMMERQVRQLARLIDDLLDISRIDRGKLELQTERAAVEAIVQSAVEIARPNIETHGHELVMRYPGTPLFVEVDPVRMAQVISNLLNNAAKFTPAGGRIEVSIAGEAGKVLIRVADTGIGLEPGAAERIFDMFVQLDSSRNQSAGGLGLGLTLARTIVERHGGTIRAESPGPGRGTTLTIELPAVAAPGKTPSLRSVSRADRLQRRVLVVDDNTDAANTLANFLEHEGHDVRTAFDGPQALTVAAEFRPDWVVLDLNLPGLDGVEVGRRLRAQPWAREVCLIALTGMGQTSDFARTEAAGFHHHLTKPVAPERVLEILAKAA